jgi:cellulose synthase/poly-beta-1,6-N-acetylglucosamine synthase-like glycosyltransferase
MLTTILSAFFILTVILITAYLVRHYVFTLMVLRATKKSTLQNTTSAGGYEPTVSILIPAHNEEKVIGALLQKIAETNYPKEKLEVLTIDDASSDATGKIAETYAKRYRFIKVLHRNPAEGGKGKPAALNAALKQVHNELILCFDADYTPHPDLIRILAAEFEDQTVGAVQGRPVVLNEPQNVVTRLITLERIGGYKIDQQARELLNLVPQFGGTVGGFRRNIIAKLGGFDESMLTEDTDLTFELVLSGYKVRYIEAAECYEEAVASWTAYWRQRTRWAKGHMQVCFKHAFAVLGCRHLTLRQKLDSLLLLHVYFMPLISLVSLIIGAYLLFAHLAIAETLWFVVPVSMYSFVGNYAPFFEVSIGAYLDKRRQAQWLTPLMIFSFLLNMPICAKAFLSLIYDKLTGRRNYWVKTEHLGNTACL